MGREVGGGDIKGAKSEQKGTAARSRLKEGNIGVLQNILKGIRYPSEGECGGLWGGGGEHGEKGPSDEQEAPTTPKSGKGGGGQIENRGNGIKKDEEGVHDEDE